MVSIGLQVTEEHWSRAANWSSKASPIDSDFTEILSLLKKLRDSPRIFLWVILFITRLRRLGDSRWTQGNAEAVVVEPVRRVVPVMIRRPAIRGLAEITAATDHAERALPWSNGIAHCTLGVLTVPVATPLPDIPLHVVETPGVCFLFVSVHAPDRFSLCSGPARG